MYGGQFEVERFVFDIEEESNIALQKLKSGNETEPDLYNNYSNSNSDDNYSEDYDQIEEKLIGNKKNKIRK